MKDKSFGFGKNLPGNVVSCSWQRTGFLRIYWGMMLQHESTLPFMRLLEMNLKCLYKIIVSKFPGVLNFKNSSLSTKIII